NLPIVQQLAPAERRGRLGCQRICPTINLLSFKDQTAFRLAQPSMTIWCLIKKEPQNQPGKAKRSRNKERRGPSIREAEPNDQRRRNHRTNSGSAIEDGHAKSTFTNGKPFGHGLGSAGPVARLTQS